MLVPLWNKSPPLAITNEVGLKPAREPVLTGRRDQSVRDQYEGTVGKRDSFGSSQMLVEDSPKVQLLEQGAENEDWSPVEDIAEVGFSTLGLSIASEKPSQSRKHLNK